MKTFYSNTLSLLAFFLLLSLHACDEGATVDVTGPTLDFQFTFADLNNGSLLKNSSSGYVLVAKTDTVAGKNIESYLSKKNQHYASVIESATVTNAVLTLSGQATFAGVDSIQIRYQIEGTNSEIILAQAAVNTTSGQSVQFNNLKINKAEAFDMIKHNLVAKIYAAYDPTKTNCFKPNLVYHFTANTILSVKVSSLAEGLLGK